MRTSEGERERIGVFGGSFDPPHCGHVLLAACALLSAPIDRLLVVPTFVHPFGKPLQPFEHRVAMCKLVFAELARAEVSCIEQELGTPSYTVRTLEALAERAPGAEFRLVIGADLLRDAPRWKDWDRVRALARPFVIGRSGYPRPLGEDGVDIDLPPIASTEIRERLRSGKSVVGHVPAAVASYVSAHGLYR
jgi:nicotinate-nucleotide adenylyltransferase